jgi:hypothetical protein
MIIEIDLKNYLKKMKLVKKKRLRKIMLYKKKKV